MIQKIKEFIIYSIEVYYDKYIVIYIKDSNSIIITKIKEDRLFEVDEKGNVHFLTIDIPSQFFDLLKKTLLEEIENHSHICDFRGENFQAKSGEAIKFALLDMENLCGD